MFSSVRVPWPRRVLKERWSLSLRFSNILIQVYQRNGGWLRSWQVSELAVVDWQVSGWC